MIHINKRKIGLYILLSIITFGIYQIYWQYLLVKNIRTIKKDVSSCTGEMLCLVFVPFYSLYWWFTRGKIVKDKFTEYGYSAIGNEMAYLILGIFGLVIVSMAIMQYDFNSLPFDSTQSVQQSVKKMNIGIKSMIVLPLICLVTVALLAFVNHITSGIIEKNAIKDQMESLKQVVPEAEDFDIVDLTENMAETVTGIYKETGGRGYAVTVETTSSYSQNPMTFTLGVSEDKKIIGVTVTNYSETKDFGSYPETFIGKDSSLEGVDVVAGVTYSSNAFKDAVKDAFAAVEEVAG